MATAGPGQSTLGALYNDTTAYLFFVLFVAALGPFQFGFQLAELNAPQAVITCESKSIESTSFNTRLPQCIRMTVNEFAIITSIFTIGGLIGAFGAGPWSSRYGRLSSMRLMTISFILGPGLQSLASTVTMMSAGRFISGLGAGAATVVVPIYISEMAPAQAKGLFGALTQVMINIGILVAQVLGYFYSRDNFWRLILATAGLIGLIQLICLFGVPESPKWLAEQGHSHQALQILRRMRGRQADLDEEVNSWSSGSKSPNTTCKSHLVGIVGETADISRLQDEEESLLGVSSTSDSHPARSTNKPAINIFSILAHPHHRSAIIAVVAVMLTQQLTGINSIVMYSVHLLTTLLPTSAALLSVGISVLNLIMTALCAPLPDRIGRKTCILLSIAGMTMSSILLATGLGKGIKILGAISTLTFVSSFAIGLGPVPFILANELVPQEAVGATQSWALAANWSATFIVSQFFPMLNHALGDNGRVYLVFAGVGVVSGGFIAWWVPETRGKSNADEVWGRSRSRDRLE